MPERLNTRTWAAKAGIWGQHILSHPGDFEPSTRFALSMLEQLSFNSVAEFGCNVGRIIGRVKTTYPEVACYGFDINPEVLEKVNDLYPKIYTRQLDLTYDLPYKHPTFDVVITSEVLQHVAPEDIDAIRQRLYDVAKKHLILIECRKEQYPDGELLNIGDDSWGGVWNYLHEQWAPVEAEVKMVRMKNDSLVAYIITKP